MSYTLPIVPDTTFTEREGVHYVGLAASQMGLIWREVPNTDLGIDGYLEVIVHGAPIGLIAIQVKSGPSHIESLNDTGFTFRAESKHVRYWLSYRLPVIVVIYDPEAQVAYWHYVQDYFKEHDDVPSTKDVPIRILKSMRFDNSAKEQLTEIAASPDSTANAMLSLRASRYKYTHELLTLIEMIELYGKRKWLGEWLPLDAEREQILIHSTLAMRGPGWFWFRPQTNRDYIPYLKSGLKHPDYHVRREAALALAAALGRGAVSNLRELLNSGSDVREAAEALASISDLTSDDRKKIFEDCWKHLQDKSSIWPRMTLYPFLCLIAKIGGTEVREQVINHYLQGLPVSIPIQNGLVRPSLLREAGHLWSKQDLSKLRHFVETKVPGLEDIAIVALAQIGGRQDLDLILDYIAASQWFDSSRDDIGWLSEQFVHLFDVQDLERLRQMLQADRNSQVVAHRALPNLCRRLDEDTLLQMLNEPISVIRSYAAKGLAAIGKANLLVEYEEELLNDADSASLIRITAALTASGNWAVIDRLLKNETYGVRQGVAEGLRYVSDERAFDYLLKLLQDDDINVCLKAGDTLSIIGNENALHKVLEWLLKHPYESSTNLIASVLIYLDRRLYSPIQWPIKKDRDFSILRYSVTRDDYR